MYRAQNRSRIAINATGFENDEKKLFFAAALILIFAATVTVTTHRVSGGESNLLMADVEALAEDESGKVKCCPDKGDTCTLSSGDVLQDMDEC